MATKEELLEKAYNLGFELNKNHGNCAQCVLLAAQEILGLKNDLMIKAATGLAGGMMLGVSACGALSGGIMAIGQKYGREHSDLIDPEPRPNKTPELAKKLHERFIEEYGSSACSDLQQRIFGRSYDWWDLAERQQYLEAEAQLAKCSEIVGKGARWVVELLLEEDQKAK